MKILALFLLFGIATASLQEELDDTVNEYILDALEGIEEVASIEHHVVSEDRQADENVNDLTKLRLKFGKQLKEVLNKIFENLKTAVEEGKFLDQDTLNKLQEIAAYFKGKKDEISEEIKELLKKIRDKSMEYLKDHIDRLSQTKRYIDDQVEESFAELNIREVLLKIKEHLKNNVDPELLKEKLEKIFNQGSELLRHFLQLIKEKAKKKMLILIDALLDEDDDEESDRPLRGIKDYWEKVKDYFKDLKIDLQEKYMKFGEWVKEHFNKGMEASKDRMENIKAIAKEFAKHAKGISKEVANEAGEFFKQYKEELGNIWEEIKERIQEIKNRKD
ncbi:uncharacterized protein PF3D7_1120000 isoform X2 [Parasteatoda tepidariorum]|nr:dynein regulatory complex subunit 4 isoform X2 [Parasteatoda tepidariorum]